MFRNTMLSLAAVLALGTTMALAPASARADHERRERHHFDRIVWQYQGGFFKDVGRGRWTESNASGTYHFQEVNRNRDFVDLWDGSRGFTVRLYDHAMYLKGGNDYRDFTKFYDGNWTE
jgi:hypothetical protein